MYFVLPLTGSAADRMAALNAVAGDNWRLVTIDSGLAYFEQKELASAPMLKADPPLEEAPPPVATKKTISKGTR